MDIQETSLLDVRDELENTKYKTKGLKTRALLGIFGLHLEKSREDFPPNIDCIAYAFGPETTYEDVDNFKQTPGAKQIEKPVYGALVFYEAKDPHEQELLTTHVGYITHEGQVISKWNIADVVKHNIDTVPKSFGEAKFWVNAFNSNVDGANAEFFWLPQAVFDQDDHNFKIMAICGDEVFLEIKARRSGKMMSMRELHITQVINYRPQNAPNLVKDVLGQTRASKLFDNVSYSAEVTAQLEGDMQTNSVDLKKIGAEL